MMMGWAARARAELPDTVWPPLKDQQVWIERTDRSTVVGKLVSVEGNAVAVMRAGGDVTTVKKSEVRSLRGPNELPVDAQRGEERAPQVDPERKDWYFRRSFAGLLAEPVACISKCDGSLLTVGGEVGSTVFAFALRYGYSTHSHNFFPDFRFFYDIKLARRWSLTPLVEVTPSITLLDLGKSVTLLSVEVRPGLRVNFAVGDQTTLFIEPVALEANVYSRVLSGGDGSSTDLVWRYGAAAGIQYRY
jgi:hypothetical protein